MISTLARVAVVGTSCSGKTTLARTLSTRLGATHIELDALYWEREWRACPTEEFRQRVTQAIARDRWVCDGNYRIVRGLVWPRATAIIWLDYSFTRTFTRGLLRTLRRSAAREVLYSDNQETLRRAFLSRESILLWIITSFRVHRREFAALACSEAFPGTTFFRCRRPAETARFLAELGDSAPG